MSVNIPATVTCDAFDCKASETVELVLSHDEQHNIPNPYVKRWPKGWDEDSSGRVTCSIHSPEWKRPR